MKNKELFKFVRQFVHYDEDTKIIIETIGKKTKEETLKQVEKIIDEIIKGLKSEQIEHKKDNSEYWECNYAIIHLEQLKEQIKK